MDDQEICIWLDRRWYQALSKHLKDETVEDKLNEYLDELLDQLPAPVYEKVSREIWAEDQQRRQELEAARVFTGFHVTEHGQDEYFQFDREVNLPTAARYLRQYLRQEPGARGESFSQRFQAREPVTAERFDELASLRMENAGKAAGVYELDFDKREFSTVHVMDGWTTYAMEDVSAAAYHAFRKDNASPDEKLRRLLDRLEGHERTSAGHLSAREISIAEDISEINGLLNFYLETDFDVDVVFGTHICTSENDDCLNVYANYDMAAGQVCDELEVDLHWADGREESVEYRLNAAEKEVMLRKMDDYCQRQTGQTLAEYSAQLMAEDIAPPAGPVM